MFGREYLRFLVNMLRNNWQYHLDSSYYTSWIMLICSRITKNRKLFCLPNISSKFYFTFVLLQSIFTELAKVAHSIFQTFCQESTCLSENNSKVKGNIQKWIDVFREDLGPNEYSHHNLFVDGMEFFCCCFVRKMPNVYLPWFKVQQELTGQWTMSLIKCFACFSNNNFTI